jgi:FKBP-type peptidyl-prolyl cis-trans isomerase (trigger factor)
MKYTCTYPEPYAVQVELTDDASALASFEKKALLELSAKEKIPGFLIGMPVPEHIAHKYLNPAEVREYSLELYLNHILPKIIKKEALVLIAPFEITSLTSLDPISITLTGELPPKLTLTPDQIEGTNISYTVPVVIKEDIDAGVADIEKRFTRYEKINDLSATAKSGDQVQIHAQGYDTK